MIEDTKKWVLSPERKAPQATREYVAHRLDGVLDKFLKTMQTTAARLQEKLLKPEVRQKGKEQVKEKARDSVLQNRDAVLDCPLDFAIGMFGQHLLHILNGSGSAFFVDFFAQ